MEIWKMLVIFIFHAIANVYTVHCTMYIALQNPLWKSFRLGEVNDSGQDLFQASIK